MSRLSQVVTTGHYVRVPCHACGQSTWTTSSPELAQCGRCRHMPPTQDEVTKDIVQPQAHKFVASRVTPACPICFENTETKMNYASSVQNESWANSDCCSAHDLCRPCVQRYVETKVLDEGLWNIRCPGEGCRYRLIDDDISLALTDSRIKQEVSDKRAKLRNDNFAPRLQELLVARDAVSTDCSETLLLAQCQVCPSCCVLVRREGGCTHMVCRCGQDFCFGCGAPFAEEFDDCVCGERDDEGANIAEDDLEGEGRPSLGFWRQLKGLTIIGLSEVVPEQNGTIDSSNPPKPVALDRFSTDQSCAQISPNAPDTLALGPSEPPKLHRAKSLPPSCTLGYHSRCF